MQRMRALHEAPLRTVADFRESSNYAEMGTRGSGSVEGGDDLLVDALCGFGIAERGEYDLLDTGVSELADSIDDVISRPCHGPGAERWWAARLPHTSAKTMSVTCR